VIESPIILIDVKWRLTLTRPGFDVVRTQVEGWGEINGWIMRLAAGKDYPYGTVLRVVDYTGTQRFLVKGGAKDHPKLVKLSEAVCGLPQNPKMALSEPASPVLDFSLPAP
jgi:hypothetical protein